MPGEAPGALKGSGVGGLWQLLLSCLGLGRVWLSGVKKAPGLMVCCPAQAGCDSGAVGSF